MKAVDLHALKPGHAVVINGQTYACCAGCYRLVRVDKWLIGSLHLCEPRRAP